MNIHSTHQKALGWDAIWLASRLEVAQLANFAVIMTPVLALVLRKLNLVSLIEVEITDFTVIYLYAAGLCIFLSKVIIGTECPPEISRYEKKESFFELAMSLREIQKSDTENDDKKQDLRNRFKEFGELIAPSSSIIDSIEKKWNEANTCRPAARIAAGILLYLGIGGIVVYFLLIQPILVFCG